MSAAILDAVSFEQVWHALGGGPLSGRGDHRRARAFWRDGSALSVSVNLPAKVWRDHVSGEGGGLLALVSTVFLMENADAWKWLADLAGVPLKPWSRAGAARYRSAMESTKEEAAALWDLWEEYFDILNRCCHLHFTQYHALRESYWNQPGLSDGERESLSAEIADVWRQYCDLRERENLLLKADPGALMRLLRRSSQRRAA